MFAAWRHLFWFDCEKLLLYKELQVIHFTPKFMLLLKFNSFSLINLSVLLLRVLKLIWFYKTLRCLSNEKSDNNTKTSPTSNLGFHPPQFYLKPFRIFTPCFVSVLAVQSILIIKEPKKTKYKEWIEVIAIRSEVTPTSKLQIFITS